MCFGRYIVLEFWEMCTQQTINNMSSLLLTIPLVLYHNGLMSTCINDKRSFEKCCYSVLIEERDKGLILGLIIFVNLSNFVSKRFFDKCFITILK